MWTEQRELEAQAEALAASFAAFMRQLVAAQASTPHLTPPLEDQGGPSPQQERGGEAALTVRQVGERLQVSKSTVYRLISSGQLAHLRVGGEAGAIRVPARALVEYVERQTAGVLSDEDWAIMRRELLEI